MNRPTEQPVSPPYRPPLADIGLALEVAGIDELLECDDFSHVTRKELALVLEEFGHFATDVLLPLDRVGDLVGVHLDPDTREVTTPPGFRDAYRAYVEGGWGALQFPRARGGGGFPAIVALAMQEMFASTNLSLCLNPVVTQGAIALLLAWGSEEQMRSYLPKLISAKWSGTMELTEPEAGSDLGEVCTLAVPGEDGRWRISGTKRFITWGEHDLTENVIHLLLARTPGAQPGARGLSVFLVPKVLVDANGELGKRNGLSCTRLEEKLGIHGSATCTMVYENAIGELVGVEGDGIRTIFTLMNSARLSIGVQGPAIGERAYQQALDYAGKRRQGRAAGVAAPSRSAIIEHPDVHRMLLKMRTCVQASRLLILRTAAYGDVSRHHPDEAKREAARAYVNLLTPIAKAWASDIGVAVSSLGIQVLGGPGYLEENGMTQRLRDSRVVPIYEGTNGIQAIDLVTRKLARDDGRAMLQLIAEIADAVDQLSSSRALAITREALNEARGALASATSWILARTDSEDALAGASAYLELAGLTLGGYLMARRAELVPGDVVAQGECNFFATEMLTQAPGLLHPITAGARRLATLSQ